VPAVISITILLVVAVVLTMWRRRRTRYGIDAERARAELSHIKRVESRNSGMGFFSNPAYQNPHGARAGELSAVGMANPLYIGSAAAAINIRGATYEDVGGARAEPLYAAPTAAADVFEDMYEEVGDGAGQPSRFVGGNVIFSEAVYMPMIRGACPTSSETRSPPMNACDAFYSRRSATSKASLGATTRALNDAYGSNGHAEEGSMMEVRDIPIGDSGHVYNTLDRNASPGAVDGVDEARAQKYPASVGRIRLEDADGHVYRVGQSSDDPLTFLDVPLFCAEPLTRVQAESRLRHEAPGSYLVRSKYGGTLALTVITEPQGDGRPRYIHHLLSPGRDGLWLVDGQPVGCCNSAQDLVLHLCNLGDSWGGQPLRHYVGSTSGKCYTETKVDVNGLLHVPCDVAGAGDIPSATTHAATEALYGDGTGAGESGDGNLQTADEAAPVYDVLAFARGDDAGYLEMPSEEEKEVVHALVADAQVREEDGYLELPIEEEPEYANVMDGIEAWSEDSEGYLDLSDLLALDD